jgi:hypothetical protein
MMRTSTKIKTAVVIFNLAAAYYASRTGRQTGRFFGVPYDFSPPTVERLRDRFWNENRRSLFTPPFFGAGWSINLLEAARRLGYLPEEEEEEPGE